jgi:hypothetical protein
MDIQFVIVVSLVMILEKLVYLHLIKKSEKKMYSNNMYEVNYTVQKKKLENSKYSLMNNEQDSQLFIFEIILKTLDDKSITMRKIKKGTQGMFILSEDNIKYSDIDRIKVSILDSNNLKNEIITKITIDHKMNYTTYLDSVVYLEFNSNSSGLLIANYNFN